MLGILLLIFTGGSTIFSFKIRKPVAGNDRKLKCTSTIIGGRFRTPDTIYEMMRNVATCIINARNDNISSILVGDWRHGTG